MPTLHSLKPPYGPDEPRRTELEKSLWAFPDRVLVVADPALPLLCLTWMGMGIHSESQNESDEQVCKDIIEGETPPEGYGLWVWEGSIRVVRYDSMEYGYEYDREISGTWRRLTEDEVRFLDANGAPGYTCLEHIWPEWNTLFGEYTRWNREPDEG